jgi:hypothetical protein
MAVLCATKLDERGFETEDTAKEGAFFCHEPCHGLSIGAFLLDEDKHK